MLFSSMLFLWGFLPLLLILYFVAPQKVKNWILLLASLVFYAWGEPKYIILMLLMVLVNYLFARLIHWKNNKWFLVLCIVVNLGLLGYFKYFNFAVQTINRLAGTGILETRDIALPLGISFYTFQVLSYVIDVYRKEINVQKNFFKLLLYVSFFPQLIAGPIVRYKDIEEQIDHRTVTEEKLAYGVKRFIYGLAKKVILSNTLAYYADTIMDGPFSQMSAGVLWVGALLYTFQIYYDFSGYSDMAIGLGSMFGFDFNENFRYPYISKSIQEFWRRWHISLSTWFREYVYIPLGGNRKGKMRTYLNLLIVFFLTGLWHGASFSFILWGLYHGFFLLIERMFLGKRLENNRIKIINHLYLWIVVPIGWVFFRLNSITNALSYIKGMFSYSAGTMGLADVVGLKMLLVLVIAFLLCGIVQKIFPKMERILYNRTNVGAVEIVIQVLLFAYCIILLASDTYNPFIYFRF